MHAFIAMANRTNAGNPGTTWARWQRDGTLTRLFEVGEPARSRMERQFDDYIRKLTLDGAVVTGAATKSLPRWTHVRPL